MAVCLVNLVHLRSADHGGLNRVAREVSLLLCELNDEYRDFHPVFAVGSPFAPEFPTWLGRVSHVIPVNVAQPIRPMLRGLNADLLLSPIAGMEAFDHIAELRSKRHIAVAADTLPLSMPQLFKPQVVIQRKASYERLKSAYRIITPSEFTRNQLATHLNLPLETIKSVPFGMNSNLSPAKDQLSQALEPATRTMIMAFADLPYLFYPSSNWLHKRHDLALASFAEIRKTRPELQLVLAGSRREAGISITDLIAKYRLPNECVHDLGDVGAASLSYLTAYAEALFFTSEYEELGTPFIEAMRFGCPVVCAPLSAMPAVCGDAALYVTGNDPLMWAQAVTEQLPLQRATLVAKGTARGTEFSWENTRAIAKNFFLESVPSLFDGSSRSVPMVSLPMALREADAPLEKQAVPLNLHSSLNVSLNSSVDAAALPAYLAYLDGLTAREKISPLGRIPILGKAIRAVIRFRNITRFLHVSNSIAQILVMQQIKLAEEVESLHPSTPTSETNG